MSDPRRDEPREAGIPLAGGVANAGAVVRIGDTVRRPLPANHATLHTLLRYLRTVGFDGAPEVLGIDERNREVLRYLPGDVPVPPYPAWSLTDGALASIARLQRDYHEAVASFVPPDDATWSEELVDPRGGSLIAHGDVCLENVVFREGKAIGLLDFEYAAPGRLVWDLSATIRMCGPLGDPAYMRPERRDLDHLGRVRLFADAYGLAGSDRPALVDAILERQTIRFVERRVEAGEEAFIAMWEDLGGKARADANDRWYREHRDALLDALT